MTVTIKPQMQTSVSLDHLFSGNYTQQRRTINAWHKEGKGNRSSEEWADFFEGLNQTYNIGMNAADCHIFGYQYAQLQHAFRSETIPLMPPEGQDSTAVHSILVALLAVDELAKQPQTEYTRALTREMLMMGICHDLGERKGELINEADKARGLSVRFRNQKELAIFMEGHTEARVKLGYREEDLGIPLYRWTAAFEVAEQKPGGFNFAGVLFKIFDKLQGGHNFLRHGLKEGDSRIGESKTIEHRGEVIAQFPPALMEAGYYAHEISIVGKLQPELVKLQEDLRHLEQVMVHESVDSAADAAAMVQSLDKDDILHQQRNITTHLCQVIQDQLLLREVGMPVILDKEQQVFGEPLPYREANVINPDYPAQMREHHRHVMSLREERLAAFRGYQGKMTLASDDLEPAPRPENITPEERQRIIEEGSLIVLTGTNYGGQDAQNHYEVAEESLPKGAKPRWISEREVELLTEQGVLIEGHPSLTLEAGQVESSPPAEVVYKHREALSSSTRKAIKSPTDRIEHTGTSSLADRIELRNILSDPLTR